MINVSEEVAKIKNKAQHDMEGAIHHLETALTAIRAGKASPSMVNQVMVDYYGNPTPLPQIANVSAGDARTILIKPWEKNMLHPIEKAIFASNMGLTPQNDGDLIRLNIPPLTEERRKELVKRVKNEGEHAKVAVRNVRKHANEVAKRLTKEGLAEDNEKKLETDIQKMTDDYIVKIDKLVDAKDKEILSV